MFTACETGKRKLLQIDKLCESSFMSDSCYFQPNSWSRTCFSDRF